MKKYTLLLGALGAAAVVALAPSSAKASIIGSAHDFSASTNYWISGASSTWVSRSNVCGICHSMHHTNPDRSAPLWTHASTLQTFLVYSSPTFNGGTPTIDGSSKACLSCHDGSIAINQTYSGTTNGGTAVFIKSSAIIPDGSPANDLRNVHPVGFSYLTARAADPDLNDPNATTVAGTSMTISQAMLKNGRVECSSCHDIHRTKGASSGSGIFTIVGSANSALCLTCHKK